MLKHAAKRLFVMLPALWLLASAVFLLSKSIPGSATDLKFDKALESANSIAKAEARRKAYQQMRQRTGEDLPLFYFRIGTAAEPDTLHKIFPETEREALKNLALTFGNWPKIATYYQNLQQFRKTASAETDPIKSRSIYGLTENLLKTTDPDKARQVMNTLQKTVCNSAEKVRCEKLLFVQRSFKELLANQKPELNYLPRIVWYGPENQYHRWLRNLWRGELGFSSRDFRPVTEILAEAFGTSLLLAVAAFTLTSISAPAIAMILSRKTAKPWRASALSFLYILESLPLFVVALGILAVTDLLGWLEIFPEEAAFVLALPALVLVNLPYLTSQAYTALQTTLQENYILAARAKGLPDHKIITRHAFRNSLLPFITLLSDFFPALLAGTVVLEFIFALPGMGSLLVSSVLERDYEVVAGLVLLIGFLKMLAHLLADVLYPLADPRLRR